MVQSRVWAPSPDDLMAWAFYVELSTLWLSVVSRPDWQTERTATNIGVCAERRRQRAVNPWHRNIVGSIPTTPTIVLWQSNIVEYLLWTQWRSGDTVLRHVSKSSIFPYGYVWISALNMQWCILRRSKNGSTIMRVANGEADKCN